MDWIEVVLESRRMVTSLGVILKSWNKTENYGTFWLAKHVHSGWEAIDLKEGITTLDAELQIKRPEWSAEFS